MGPHDLAFGGTNGSGKLQAFATSPANPAVLYTGGGLGSGNQGPYTEAGALRSDDGGATWKRINAGLSDGAVNVLWADPTNALTVLAGTEFGGIFRSTNGGDSWTRVSPSAPVSAIVNSGGVLLAGTLRGIEQSTDLGASWQLLHATTSPVRCLAAEAGYVVAGSDRGDILWKSPQDTFFHKVAGNEGTVWDVAIDPVDPQTAFFILGWHPSRLFRTTDGGVSWSEIPRPASLMQSVVVRAADRAVLIAANSQFAMSKDSGNTWNSYGIPWDARRLFLLPGRSTIFVGTDQGLHSSDDQFVRWRDYSASIHASIVYGLAIQGSTFLTSAQDMGPLASTDGGRTWWFPRGALAEGGSVGINPADPLKCYAFTIAGLALSVDGCRTFGRRAGPRWENYGGPLQNLFAFDPRDATAVYVGAADGVWKSANDSDFAKLDWPLKHVTQVVFDPIDSGVIYVTTDEGLFQTLDGGVSWKKLEIGASSWAYSITISPKDNHVLLAALADGAGRNGGVWRSTDRGLTFQPSNAGLPETVVNLGIDQTSIAFNPLYGSGEEPLAALSTTSGVYLSTDGGRSWQEVTSNLVSQDVYQVVWSRGYLYVVTAGEGVLRSELPFGGPSRRRSVRH